MSDTAATSIAELLKLIWETVKEVAIGLFSYKKGELDAAMGQDLATAQAETSALQQHMEHATDNASLTDDAALAKLRSHAIPDADGH